MKRIIYFASCCIMALNLQAQLITNEQPIGLKDGTLAQMKNIMVLPAPDMECIEKEDKVAAQLNLPQRYTYPILVNYTPENSGGCKWTTGADYGD